MEKSPYLTQTEIPPGRKERVKMPVPPNRLSPDQRLPGAVLRKILNDKMNNGEILTTEPNVEEAPFPDQQNNAQVMTCSHTMVSDLKDKDIYKGSTSEAPQDLLGQDEITPMEVCQAEDVELLANGL